MLEILPQANDPKLLVGIASGDDAAVYQLSEDLAIVQTVDVIPPIVDDPYTFGAIAAANALSDIYATGARPITALNIVTFPASQPRRVLKDILRGGADKVSEISVSIVGGHTVQDDGVKYGLAVTGVVTPGNELRNDGAKPGDVLLLTKPIGTGAICLAARGKDAASNEFFKAVEYMTTLNEAASEAAISVGISACTDVTGFSLIGHLQGMARASGVGAQLYYSKVPCMDGAVELAVGRDFTSGGTHRNRKYFDMKVQWDSTLNSEEWKILYEPQTSGGLLMAVSAVKVDMLIKALEAKGVACRAVIGEVIEGLRGTVRVCP